MSHFLKTGFVITKIPYTFFFYKFNATVMKEPENILKFLNQRIFSKPWEMILRKYRTGLCQNSKVINICLLLLYLPPI